MGNRFSLVEKLASYIVKTRFEDLPRSTVEKAKDIILTDLRAALTGHDSEASKIALRMIPELGSSGRCTVIGDVLRSSMVYAAFVNSVMIESLMQDDTLWPAGVHAGSMIIAAALSAGEEMRKSGRDILLSIILGYEVVGKIGKLVNMWRIPTPRRPTPVLGIFGPTAAVAKLFELDEKITAHALGYAANFSMGLGEGLKEGTSEWSFQSGMATMEGILSVMLAREGATAARESLEGEYGFYRAFLGKVPDDIEKEIDAVGEHFEILEVTNKPYPCCGHHVTPIELMKHIVNKHDLKPENIRKVHVSLSPRVVDPRRKFKGPFEKQLVAILSLPFSIALVILDREIIMDRVNNFTDGKIYELSSKVEVEAREDFDLHSAEIEVVGKNSEKYRGRLRKYDPTREELKDKFVNEVSCLIGKEKVDQFLSGLERLESIEDITIFTKYLSPQP